MAINLLPRVWRWPLAALSLLVLTACGGQSSRAVPSAPAAAQPTAAATAAPSPVAAGPTAAPTTVAIPAGSFQNPVLRDDFPDPAILKVGDTYYAYATNAYGRHIQVAQSPDLVKWKDLPDAMPMLASWARTGGSFVWAPEVIQLGDQFLLYYTARDKQADKQCIGVATSAKPEGPFQDTRDKALVCQTDQGGSIDSDPFRDGDKLYLYWKNDGNCCGQTTYIYAQELAADGLSLTGAPTQLVHNDAFWEGNLVEAPTMFKHDNSYFLFFSANDYSNAQYAVGYASCASVTGPCTDARENPILKSRMDSQPPVIGAGHQTLVQVGEQTWIVYHAWEVGADNMRGNRRLMWLDRLNWVDGKPVIAGPTTAPQPKP